MKHIIFTITALLLLGCTENSTRPDLSDNPNVNIDGCDTTFYMNDSTIYHNMCDVSAERLNSDSLVVWEKDKYHESWYQYYQDGSLKYKRLNNRGYFVYEKWCDESGYVDSVKYSTGEIIKYDDDEETCE